MGDVFPRIPVPATYATMRPAMKRAFAARAMETDDSATIDMAVRTLDRMAPRTTGALGAASGPVAAVVAGAVVGLVTFLVGREVGKAHERRRAVPLAMAARAEIADLRDELTELRGTRHAIVPPAPVEAVAALEALGVDPDEAARVVESEDERETAEAIDETAHDADALALAWAEAQSAGTGDRPTDPYMEPQ